jgi:hypothetical protein
MTDWYSEVTGGPSPAPSAPPAAKTDWYSEVTQQAKQTAEEVAGPPLPPYSGAVLPFSRNAKGETSFDSNAGLLGVLKRTFTAPHDIYKGQLSPFSVEGQERATEFATTISPAGAGGRAFMGKMRPKETPVPTAEELKAAAKQGYKAVKDTGAEYPGASIGALADDVQRALEADGLIAELSPQTFAVLNKLRSPPEGSSVTVTNLDAARKALGRIGGNFQNPTEQEAARRVVERLDAFISSGGKADAVAGTPPAQGLPAPWGPRPTEEAARHLTEARGNTAALKRSERITGAEDRAELNAAVANSGQNLDNAIRQRLRDILVNPKQARGFNEAELTFLEGIARGSRTGNALRFAGNLMGGGGGLGAVVSGGVSGAAGSAMGLGPMGILAGAAVPATGLAAKKTANALTMRKVDQLDEMIRKRSPLYEQRAANPGMEPAVSQDTVAMIRLLLPQIQAAQQQ